MATEEIRARLQPGDEVAGKYRIDRVLGQGGMGIVLAATHILTRQRVALKLLLPDSHRTPEQDLRFMNEARAVVQIHSEHVARVTDIDRLPSGEPYMVMEYLDGQDLSALLVSRGPLPMEEAVDYVLQACEALAEAHASGIVHRDLKPANLFLTHRRDGSALVKVLDFGISRLNEPGAGPRLTLTRGTMGSPLYMSPEQLTTPKDVDARSDIWSLGVVLFELLAATWPFEAETMGGLIVEIATQPPRRLGTKRPDLPPEIEAVIERCLQKRREDRFPSVAELAAALAPCSAQGSRLSIDRISRILGSSPALTVPASAMTLDPRSGPAPVGHPPSSGASAAVVAPLVTPLGTPLTTPLSAAAISSGVLGARSIDPTAATFDGATRPAPGIASNAPRWPVVAGAIGMLAALALFAFLRSSRPLAPLGAVVATASLAAPAAQAGSTAGAPMVSATTAGEPTRDASAGSTNGPRLLAKAVRATSAAAPAPAPPPTKPATPEPPRAKQPPPTAPADLGF